MTKPTKLQHTRNEANVAFAQLIDELNDLGVTQKELANRLGVSPGQISRVKQGERPAIARHLKTLTQYAAEIAKNRKPREAALARSSGIDSILSIDRELLGRLTERAAVKAFRELLFARAASRGIPTTAVNISEDISTPDGGVDASVSDKFGAKAVGDDLLETGTRFQIKTGAFSPSQPKRLEADLFGKKPIKFANLGSGVQDALRRGRRFVYVCFGKDPVDSQLRAARLHLAELFAKCGYPNAKADVWGQTHLVGLFNQYPSLCLRLRGHDYQGFRPHQSWSNDDDMQPDVRYSPEMNQLVEELRQQLISGKTPHIRLIGEPGVGKTRLAFEITRDKQIAPLTLYVRESRTLLQSPFINELVQSDDHRFVVFVVDECPNNDRAELWNVLKSKGGRIRVISIDHGPDDTSDDSMRIVPVAPVGPEEITAIIMGHGIEKHEAERWAGYCQGCPRVAHVIGDNLQMNRNDLLQPPATVDVWKRFVVGHDDPTSEEVELRKIVLRHVALFEKFGFGGPVVKEAEFIAQLCANCDPRLTWPRFQSVVATLRQRRILQGVTTLYLTPRLLHVHLFREFWRNYSFDIVEALSGMPPALRNWFVRMLRYAGDSPEAGRAIDGVLEDESLFPSGAFPDCAESGRIVDVLCEARPDAALRCLRRTIGEMSVDARQRLREPRQFLVWALEKIAVQSAYFDEAAEFLLMLAEAENSTNANNATGVFLQLFSLIPGFAPTQADPGARLTFLDEALKSASSKRRELALKACEKALDTFTSFRTIGPEHQGLQRKLEFWTPKTYGELWECHRAVWDLLVGKLACLNGEDRSRVSATLVAAAWSSIHIPPLTDSVVETLNLIASAAGTGTPALVEFVKRQLRNEKEKLRAEVRVGLEAILTRLNGHDFGSKLQRFVAFATWEDQYGQGAPWSTALDELADEATRNPEQLRAQLHWLAREASNPAYAFAYRVSRRDPESALLGQIVSRYSDGSGFETPFLSGYLAGIFERDAGKWEEVAIKLADDDSLAERFSDIVIASGISDRIATKILSNCRAGRQGVERLGRWWFAPQLKGLRESTVVDMIALLLENPTGRLWASAVQIAHSYFMEGDTARALPEELVLDLLTHGAMCERHATHEASYYWSRLAAAFLEQYPRLKWEFFGALLRNGAHESSLLTDLNSNREALLSDVLRQDPEQSFACISEVFEECDEMRSYGFTRWLSQGANRLVGDNEPGPIQYIPAHILFSWVDKDANRRGAWLAHVLPKTLDTTVAGRLTRDFVARYGNDRGICGSLNAHFHARSWCGPESAHYRGLREEARDWLVDERNPTVIRWVTRYIEGLTSCIGRAEIDEEREF
ncbi:MAG TPA: helix-turn-helix transcriptional regulator [Pirellulales bacterium]|jgi:transcriptional regulator with XRE-family HTH domain/DNA polymerase III delta prime subunit